MSNRSHLWPPGRVKVTSEVVLESVRGIGGVRAREGTFHPYECLGRSIPVTLILYSFTDLRSGRDHRRQGPLSQLSIICNNYKGSGGKTRVNSSRVGGTDSRLGQVSED